MKRDHSVDGRCVDPREAAASKCNAVLGTMAQLRNPATVAFSSARNSAFERVFSHAASATTSSAQANVEVQFNRDSFVQLAVVLSCFSRTIGYLFAADKR
jgi:hypothetical protein